MRHTFVLLTSLLLGAAAPTPTLAATATAAAAPAWDGLTEVNSRRMGTTFLLPGADFRPYKKVMLDEPQVAFRNNWLRDINRGQRGGVRVTQSDADRIMAGVATNTTDVFAAEFARAGFEVVSKPGPGVLRLRTDIVNLFVNAPDVATSGRSQSFTTNAGEATIVLEARDSQTGALLGRAIDRRQARNNSNVAMMSNRVTNTADFRRIAQSWARTSAEKLKGLQAISPIPDPLTPGQKIN